MRDTKTSQSVLISGESGAGKTETTKFVLAFVARVAGRGGGASANVAEQILQSNPVLEAYGNAKTLRNNNSSRFGKWMKIEFAESGAARGPGGTLLTWREDRRCEHHVERVSRRSTAAPSRIIC